MIEGQPLETWYDLFRTGSQVGLLPDALLNLNLGQVQAVIQGYTDRVNDQVCVAVWSGYYSAYYNSSKHAKKPTEIIKKIQQSNMQQKHSSNALSQDITEDIEQFAKRDLQFAFAMTGGNSNADECKSKC